MAKVDAKVVLLGKEYGGKTSLIERFLHGRFCGDEVPYQNTIGAGYGAKKVDVFGRHVFLGIWDTAGSERYQAMSKIYYRNAWAAIVCYDLTDLSSWEKAQFWVQELRHNEPNCRVYFCGTKLDLIENDSSLRKVNDRMVKEFASAYMLPFAASETDDVVSSHIFETSSKTGEGVKEIFLQIAKDFVKESKDRQPSSPWAGSDAPFGLNGDRSINGEERSCKC